ncbi:MAG: hypothetical protein E6J89_18295 [Deltaproteobacteria bacterium]|nr:MAG: hypothetical protein E6J89_18295 [Deltaproteobacteria bacterium]
MRWWDFLFYATFGFVVTSSVRIAGVLLVFSYLIVPAAVAALLTNSVAGRLLIGWGIGFIVSVLGLIASAAWDLPTGATVVTTFGILAAAVALGLVAGSLIGAVRARGLSALTGIGWSPAPSLPPDGSPLAQLDRGGDSCRPAQLSHVR